MADYSTIQQHEPLRVPAGWGEGEKRFVAQLEEVLDDLYRRFNRLRIEDFNKSVRLTYEQIEVWAEDGIDKVNSTAVTINSSGLYVKTNGVVEIQAGATFTVSSGNFIVDEDGNLVINNAVITNASVTGELTSGGASVLTEDDIIVSSTAPSNPTSGLVWIRPTSASVLKFSNNYNTATPFSSFTPLEGGHSYMYLYNPGEGATGDTPCKYKIKIPYKLTKSVTTARTLSVTLKEGNNSVTFGNVTLSNAAGNHTVTITRSNSNTWLGNTNSGIEILMELTASGVSNPYAYHQVPAGSVIELTCISADANSSNWSTTEVKVYNP